MEKVGSRTSTSPPKASKIDNGSSGTVRPMSSTAVPHGDEPEQTVSSIDVPNDAPNKHNHALIDPSETSGLDSKLSEHSEFGPTSHTQG